MKRLEHTASSLCYSSSLVLCVPTLGLMLYLITVMCSERSLSYEKGIMYNCVFELIIVL